jgi:hypothetical protein
MRTVVTGARLHLGAHGVFSPSANQLLRGALASEEIPAAAPPEETPPMLGEDNSLVSGYVRTLTPNEMVLADKMTRAG